MSTRPLVELVGPVELEVPGRVPVFVDDSGRRRRYTAWFGRGLAVLVGAYVLLLAASLARAPWVPKVSLPIVGNVLKPPGPQALALGATATTTQAPALAPGAPGAAASAPAGGVSPTGAASGGAGALRPGPTSPGVASTPTATTLPASATSTTVALPGSSGTAPGRTSTTVGSATTTRPSGAGTHNPHDTTTTAPGK